MTMKKLKKPKKSTQKPGTNVQVYSAEALSQIY